MFRVVVRCRPSAEEKAWRLEGTGLQYTGGEADSQVFAFDRVFGEASSHPEVYQSIEPLVAGALQGYNVGVVAYGLPGAGKSHTIFGTSGQSRRRQEAQGVIVRCAQQLFDGLQKAEEGRGSACHVTTTFCQVFDDGRVADLFDTKKRNLGVTEGTGDLLYSVPGLTKHVVTSTNDVVRLVEKGYLMRNATGCLRETVDRKQQNTPTAHPLQQYRQHNSHALFTFGIEHLGSRGDDRVTVSHLTVADLAGKSIEMLHSGLPCPDAGIETLNRVLTTLPLQGVPAASSLFVKSSLTKLLEPYFGGNCQTLIIANMEQSEAAATATRSCLQLLEGARKIKNYSRPTTVPLSESALGSCLAEVERLRLELSRRLGDGSAVTSWEATADSAVKINGALHEQLSSSCRDLLQQAAQAERQVVWGGRGPSPSQPSLGPATSRSPSHPISRGPAASPSHPPSRGPAAMVRPQAKGSGSSITFPDTARVPLTAAAPQSMPRPHPAQEESDSDSLPSIEDTDSSDSETEHPDTITGPPPPPLRGIPHVKPDSDAGDLEPAFPALLPPPAPRALTAPILVRQASSPARQQDASVRAAPPRPVPPFLAQPLQRPKTPKFSDDSPQQSGSHPALPVPLPPGEATRLHTEPAPPKPAIPAPVTPASNAPVGPAFTSSPKARRTLLPLLNERPKASAASPQPSLSQPGHPLARGGTTSSIPPPLPPQQLPTFHPLPSRAPLRPLRPVGVGPSPSSRPTLPPMWPSPHSEGSHTSSTVTLTDSDSGLSDEARDTFDPNMRQRQLSMQPIRPYATTHSSPLSLHPVLPPIAQAPSPASGPPSTPPAHSHPPTPTYGTPPHRPSDPPSYEQASLEASPRQPTTSGGSPSDYYQEPRAASREGRGEGVDMTQYVSSEEIHIASMEGVKAAVMRRLAMRFGVDYRDHGGRTPLMYAVLGNQPKMCEVLLGMGAAVNTKDSSNLTPLLWATYQAKPHCMKVLLCHGSDTQLCDPEGRTAYHWAVKTPNIHCLKLLCKYANSSIINNTDKEGLTPLHWAVMCDQPSHVRLLLTSTSADVSLQDPEGRTALNFAVLSFSPACIKAILDCRESAVNLVDAKGRTALHYACAEGSADCVRTLLSYHSCNLHCTDGRGTTPLHWSAAANQPGLLQLLLRRGADRARRDSEDMTALDYAQQREHSECVRILRTYGLRRPASALSVASQVSIQAMASPPEVDEFGHIPPRRPKRRFSLSGTSVSSIDRLPADGQAHSEGFPEEHGETETAGQVADSSAPAERQQSGSSASLTRWAGASNPQQQPPQPARHRTRWRLLCCCGQSNIIVPVSSTHSLR